MDGRSIFLLLLSIAWICLCQRWYCCWMQVACQECTDEPINKLAIGFLPNSIDPDTTAAFGLLIQQLKEERRPNSFLEISGCFQRKELVEGITDLGMARAKRTLPLLQSHFPEDSIVLRSQKVLETHAHGAGFKKLVELQWLPLKMPATPAKLIVHFRNGQSKPTLSEFQKSQINAIKDYALQYNKVIAVNGHSDKSGNEASNKVFSKKRATSLQEYLIGQGVPASKIQIQAFGSDQPINEAEPDLNRRVEIFVSNQ